VTDPCPPRAPAPPFARPASAATPADRLARPCSAATPAGAVARPTGARPRSGPTAAARRVALSAAALACSALPRSRPADGRERVLLIRPDHLGDLLLATAVLADLRRRRPEAELWALVGPWSAPILAANPDLDRLLAYPFPWFDRQPLPSPPARYAAAGALATWLRPLGFAEAIVLRPDHWWGALAVALARIPSRVGYGLPELRPLLTRALPPPPREHAVLTGLRLVGGQAAVAGARPGSPPTRFPVSPADRLAAARLLVGAGLAAAHAEPAGADPTTAPAGRVGQPQVSRGAPGIDPGRQPEVAHGAPAIDAGWQPEPTDGARAIDAGRPYVLLHPGASSTVKRWPAARWARVADWLAERGLAVVLAAGPGEEGELAAICARAGGAHHRLPRPPSLSELGAILAGASLALGADSLPMHLATAVGTPTLRLFGPGDETLFGPWGDPARHRALRAPGTAPDPSWFGQAGQPHPTLLALEVDAVLAELETILP
jgi:ADP-heptose:LPS heptosyltransferase